MKLSIKKLSESKGHRSPIYALCHYKENRVLTGGGEGWIAEWDLSNPGDGKLLASVPTSVFSLFYIKSKDIIVAGDRDGGLHWIDSDGKSNDVFAHNKGVYGLIECGDFICSIGGDGYLTFWEISSQKAFESFQISTSALRSMILTPAGYTIYIGSSDGYLHTFDLETMKLEASVKVHDGTVFSIGIANYGDIISGGKDALLNLHRFIPGKIVHTINAHWFAIYAIKMCPLGDCFATASRDKTIRLWSLPDYKPITTIDYGNNQGHIRSVNNLLWSEDGSKLISVSDDTTMIIWEIEIVD